MLDLCHVDFVQQWGDPHGRGGRGGPNQQWGYPRGHGGRGGPNQQSGVSRGRGGRDGPNQQSGVSRGRGGRDGYPPPSQQSNIQQHPHGYNYDLNHNFRVIIKCCIQYSLNVMLNLSKTRYITIMQSR